MLALTSSKPTTSFGHSSLTTQLVAGGRGSSGRFTPFSFLKTVLLTLLLLRHYVEGGDFGNREDKINALVRSMV